MTTRKSAPKPPSVSIGPIRFDPDLHAKIKSAATADGRSIAGYIRQVLREKLSTGLKAGEKGE